VIDHLEGSVIKNIIRLDNVLVRDILTPRVVVFRLRAEDTIEESSKEILSCHFSRIPLFTEDDPDHLVGYVTLRDLYRQFIDGSIKRVLNDIKRPLKTIPELMSVDDLLQQMFAEKEHICAVVDEHGSLAGIITLEDIMEEIIGREILDEYDTVSDLRKYALSAKDFSIKKK
jgi:CBS domain containing-hemolysin-like protein